MASARGRLTDCIGKGGLVEGEGGGEDGVVAASAKASGCDHVVTRNVADFAGSPGPTIIPADFLKLLPAPATQDEGQ